MIASVLTLSWVAFSIWVSGPWRDDLEAALGPLMGWVIPIFLAYIPALVIGFMIFTLLITRYQRLPLEPPAGEWPEGEWPSVTILIAAWNEGEAIERTLERIARRDYRGTVAVVVADNNSTDDTAERADAAGERLALDYRRVFEEVQGKHHALNTALATVTTPLVVTVDADTHVQGESLTRLIVRLASRPQDQHVSACAAALIAENPAATYVTRMQQWDYRLGINGVKRMQAAYNTALVAQGAFSAYWTEDLRAVGGWPDAIGEDIVLTWAMLGSRGLVQYEPLAVGFTVVPEKLDRLLSQRSRWARGMLEGLRRHPLRSNPECWRSSSPVSTTSFPSSTSESSSSGFPEWSSSCSAIRSSSAGGRCSCSRSRWPSSACSSDGRHVTSSAPWRSIRNPTSAGFSATSSRTRCSARQPLFAATVSNSRGRTGAGSKRPEHTHDPPSWSIPSGPLGGYRVAGFDDDPVNVRSTSAVPSSDVAWCSSTGHGLPPRRT